MSKSKADQPVDYVDLVDTTVYIEGRLTGLKGTANVLIPLNFVYGIQPPIIYN